MHNAYFQFAEPVNEPVLGYAPGSAERKALQQALAEAKSKQRDIPMYINGQEVRSGVTEEIRPPHETAHLLGHFHKSDKTHVNAAIEAALGARQAWSEMPWEHRAGIFLKAADLLATRFRYKMNAATMLGQSKNCYQAEIDSACELIDFLRFNVHFLTGIYNQQPLSSAGVHNRMEYRPLEGFVLAVTPFNFSAIGGNLPTSAAMCGNVVVWKPANTQIYSASVFMEILLEAGLPAGVINLIYPSGPVVGEICYAHPDFARRALHWIYRSIPEHVEEHRRKHCQVQDLSAHRGETGGKDFVFVHPTAQVDAVVADWLVAPSNTRDRNALPLPAHTCLRILRKKLRLSSLRKSRR
jgi:1-pyrroline-5-carboxylate dehydrogenase